ncbi:hypothetical protein BBP40_006521 [Aspergillus hancockii]|nr:hypothetical protein BBP40_006521 [Aspergillus hancockii]
MLEINGANMSPDPFFSPAGTKWEITKDKALTVTNDPGLYLDQLPVIDAVLLSHEDHPDNLDDLCRRPVDGRRVFTTPWEEIDVSIAEKKFQIIGTPTQYVPGDECMGFIVTGEGFGHGRDGLPNAIYFSGNTIYVEELKKMADEYHIYSAVSDLDNTNVPMNIEEPNGPLRQITMDGRQAAKLFRDIKAEVLVPMQYERWHHFIPLGRSCVKFWWRRVSVMKCSGLSRES